MDEVLEILVVWRRMEPEPETIFEAHALEWGKVALL
jgi:hypothetical protein